MFKFVFSEVIMQSEQSNNQSVIAENVPDKKSESISKIYSSCEQLSLSRFSALVDAFLYLLLKTFFSHKKVKN